jgi:excisionase family DNA binding protein
MQRYGNRRCEGVAMQTVERAALSVKEAAERLGISRSMAFKLIKRGELRSVKAGTRTLVPVAATDEFLETSPGNSVAK